MRRRLAFWLLLACSLAALAAGGFAWLHARKQSLERELSAKGRLSELGALVVMDGRRSHVRSVNLSTLKSPDTLDEAIALLPALTHLASLDVDYTSFRDEHSRAVAQLTRLENLVLSHTPITNTTVENIGSLSNLKSLHLSDTALTNACLPALGRLHALTILDLSGTQLSGSFEPLRELANLQWLVMRRLPLDAAAIGSLGQCVSLNRVTLDRSLCPAEALESLAKTRPNLTIDD